MSVPFRFRRSVLAVTALLIASGPLGASSPPVRIEVPDLATHHAPQKPWTGLDARDGPERFSFAVVGDNTGGEIEGVFEQGIAKLNLLQPGFVMSVGDLIEGPHKTGEDIKPQWDRFESWTARLDAPFFYTPGNHDIQNRESEAMWKQRFGVSYYHMRYKDTLFLVLNSEYLAFEGGPKMEIEEDARGRTGWRTSNHVRDEGRAMLAYSRHVLAENADVRWTFVFFHKPLWDPDFFWPREGLPVPDPRDPPTNPGFIQLQKMLEGRNYTLLAGHNHDYMYDNVGQKGLTQQHITMASTGGGSDMRGLAYGEFHHVLWVTMTANGPVFANLMLDGIQPKDLRVPSWRKAALSQKEGGE